MQSAIRAGDRDAIRRIMAYRAERRTPETEEEEPLPERARSCLNSDDYITNERWSANYEPTISIRYMDFDETISGYFCYRKDDLLRLSTSLEHSWVIPYNDSGLYFDDDGKVRSPRSDVMGYGEPSVVEKFVKLPPQYYILYDSFIEAIDQNDRFVAIPIYQTRVGTPNEDAYQPSTSHGQAPDTTVYYLVDEDSFNEDRNRIYGMIYDEIYHMKTSRKRDTLQAINSLQDTFRQAQADNQHYLIDLPAQKLYVPSLEHPTVVPMAVRIVQLMIDSLKNPSGQTKETAEFFGRLYVAYQDGQVIDTDQLIPDTDPIGSYRWDTIEIVLENIDRFIELYKSNETLRDKLLVYEPNIVIGGMIRLLTYIMTSNLTLWLNTQKYIEFDQIHRFGPYQIPMQDYHIYDVIVSELFVHPDYDQYLPIRSWNDLISNHISLDAVINTILRTPTFSTNLFLRVYLSHDNTYLTIYDIYQMFEIIFQAGYAVDDTMTIVRFSDQPNVINRVRDIIDSYVESDLLLLFMDLPKLELLTKHIAYSGFNLNYFIRNRLNIIGRTESIILELGNMYRFEGTVPLTDNYPPNYYNQHNRFTLYRNELVLMYYLDPRFANLIGLYPFTGPQLNHIKDEIQKHIDQ